MDEGIRLSTMTKPPPPPAPPSNLLKRPALADPGAVKTGLFAGCLPLIGCFVALGFLAVVIGSLNRSSNPLPAETAPPSTKPALRQEPTLQTASELTFEQKLYVSGAMAGAACEAAKRGASQEVAGAAYRTTLLSKGIDAESTFRDSQIVELSKIAYLRECK